MESQKRSKRLEEQLSQVRWDLRDSHLLLTQDTIRLLIATTTFALVLDLFFAEPVPITTYLLAFSPFLGTYILAYILLQRSHIRVATLLVTLGTVVAQIGLIYFVRGHEAQAIVSFVNLVLIAGFILGPFAALATSALGVLSVLSYFLLETSGQLPQPEVVTGPKAAVIALGTTLFTTGGLVFIAIRHVRTALVQEREALTQAKGALSALEEAHSAMDFRTHLAEELVKISHKLIETAPPSDLASHLCRTVCDKLCLERVWVVGRGGAIFARAAAKRDGPLSSKCMGKGSFPFSCLDRGSTWTLEPEELDTLAMWTEVSTLDESMGKLIAGTDDLYLVIAGERGTCLSEPVKAFCSAAAGLLGSGLARTSAEERFRQSQRMDAVGRLAAGLVHDFNNLLTAIMAGTDLVKSRLARQLPVETQVQAIESATAHAANLTDRLMAFTAAKQGPPEVVELTGLVEGIFRVLERTIEERIQLSSDISDELLWVRADPVEVERAVMNLVLNARDAITLKGAVKVSVRADARISHEHSEPQQVALLSVEDDGEGMSAEVERRIFEPFFTTREERGGHGLGLSAVYGLSKVGGGSVRVQSRPGEGALFEISLPLVGAPEEFHGALEQAPLLSSRSECAILVVEDSEDVRTLLLEVLQDAGYGVYTAVDGTHALEMLKVHEHIRLVISDVVMPRLDGLELAEVLASHYPDLGLILMSGYAPGDTEVKGVRRLHKPFAIDDLLRSVERSLAERFVLGGRGAPAEVVSPRSERP